MARFWDRISRIGVQEGLDSEQVRSVIFINRMVAVVLFFCVSSIVINLALATFDFVPVLSAASLLLVLIYMLHSYGRYPIAQNVLMTVMLVTLTYMVLRAGLGSGLEFYFLSFLVLPVMVLRNVKLIYLYQAVAIGCMVLQKLYYDRHHQHLAGHEAYDIFYIVNSVYSGALIALAIFFFRNLNRRNEQQVLGINQTMKTKNAELERVNKQLESFTYSVSHDLRAPLRSVQGFSSILLSKYQDVLDEEGREILGTLVKEGARLSKLIEDLLAFSRSGIQEMRAGPIDVAALVQEVLQELAPPGNRHISITTGSLGTIHADYVLLKQVFYNLVANAVKYTSKTMDAHIEIGSYHQDSERVFYVKDNGAGFDMQYAGKLFGVFQRMHSTKEFEGTGVGLAIVKNIIERHGGHIWAEASPGQGAVFYFTLPEERA